jgi:hypothetical protein
MLLYLARHRSEEDARGQLGSNSLLRDTSPFCQSVSSIVNLNNVL